MPDSRYQFLDRGRLLSSSRGDVDAGIAMAATGLLAVVCWFGVVSLLLLTDTATAVTDATNLAFAATFGVLFAPFVSVTSFLVGTYCWRVADRDEPDPRAGALLGACTAAAGMVGGSVGMALVAAGVGVVNGTLAVREVAVVSTVTVVSSLLFVVVFAGWLLVPLGAVGGWYHERAKTGTEDPV